MMTVVFFDRITGEIDCCAQLSARNVAAAGRPYIQVPEYRPDYDQTHRVVAGELVEKTS